MFNHDLFLARLQHCPGGPWTVHAAQSHLDALVLQPASLSPDAPWADADQFLDFLASTFHRRLLQCFVGENVNRVWTVEDLLKRSRPPSPQALSDALERCVFWQIALAHSMPQAWQGHPRLATLNNLGGTFEWVVQRLLERDYGALVRRHVTLGELADRREIDVLALLDGSSLLVECKSSSKSLTDRQLDRFVAKARGFPADRALLLIDTDDPHQMQQRVGQLGQAMWRAFGDASVGAIQQHTGSSVVHVRENIYVADTGGGIASTLQAVLAGTPGHS